MEELTGGTEVRKLWWWAQDFWAKRCLRDSTRNSIRDVKRDGIQVRYKWHEGIAINNLRLANDLEETFNNPAYSDVEFISSDGVKVHACRFLVAARSVRLREILANGKGETLISLSSIHSTVLLPALEFLSTGTLHNHALKSWRNALEVIRDTRFLLVGDVGLEELCVKYLVLELTWMLSLDPDNTQLAAERLSTSLEFVTVIEQCDRVNIIVMELVIFLSGKYLDPATLHSLSKEAFCFFLSRAPKRRGAAIRFGEYVKLRYVVLWCACLGRSLNSNFQDVEAEVNSYLPSGPLAYSLMRDPQNLEKHVTGGTAAQQLSPMTLRAVPADTLASLLTLVETCAIPPVLLSRVIEPLNILPASETPISALRLHEPIPPQPTSMADMEVQWELGGSLHSQPSDFHNPETKSVTLPHSWRAFGCSRRPYLENVARALCPMGFPYGVFVWDVIIEKTWPHATWEIGAIRLPPRLEDYRSTYYCQAECVSSHPLGGWALRVRIANHAHIPLEHSILVGKGLVDQLAGSTFTGWDDESYSGRVAKPYGNGKLVGENGRIRVRFDMFQRNCSFSIDGEDFGVAFSEITCGAIYVPAVSCNHLGSDEKSQMRLELVSGFDIV